MKSNIVQFTRFKSIKHTQGSGITAHIGSLAYDILSPALMGKSYPSKDSCPLFIAASLPNDSRASGAVPDHYSAIVIDYDAGIIQMPEAVEKLSIYGLGAMFYTSASHLPDKPRWRCVLPTSKPITSTERHELTGLVNAILGGVLGSDSFDIRAFYIGRVAGAVYQSAILPGHYVDDFDFDLFGTKPIFPEGAKAANDSAINELDELEKAVLHELPDSEIETLKSALEYLAGQGVADEYPTLAPIGLALKPYGEIGFELFDNHFCKLSARYDEAGIEACWERFTGSVTGYKAILAKAQEAGWSNPGKGDALPVKLPKGFSLSSLDGFTLRGQSKNMKSELQAETYVLEGIALRGQATIIYAEANAGKTLTTLKLLCEAIREGNIVGTDVFYLNADDNARGLVTKVELCEQYGFEMLAPGHNGFKAEYALPIMAEMIAIDGACTGKVFILDTAKKFTDLMDKKASSGFMVLVREFVSKGGTVIALAHVNKSKDSEGKAVHAGTTDLKDDSDAAYILEVNGTVAGIKSVTYRRVKARGGNDSEITFEYLNVDGTEYMDIFDSVVKVDNVTAGKFRAEGGNAKLLEKHLPVIEAIKQILQEGITVAKTTIESEAMGNGIARNAFRTVIGYYDGRPGYWECINPGRNNGKIYILKPLVEIDPFADKIFEL